LVFYPIDRTNESPVVRRVLGNRFSGALVADR